DPTRFKVNLHVCGDSFAGFGDFNDLATNADLQAFAGELLKGVNEIYAPTGVQVDIGSSMVCRITNAQVQSVNSRLVEKGVTILAARKKLLAPSEEWGRLGMDASDPAYGNGVDVFVVHSEVTDASSAGTTGICNCA